ncbi:hypothetical protein [Streptomyces sp. NPDC017991]|uniref:hypothetical protein n=1 Tax=Streptomyces sp. NPDC017991 TaxID=3365026 RepID=UPI0037ACA503
MTTGVCTKAEAAESFDSLELVESGIVPAHRRHLDTNVSTSIQDTVIAAFGVLVRKP